MEKNTFKQMLQDPELDMTTTSKIVCNVVVFGSLALAFLVGRRSGIKSAVKV